MISPGPPAAQRRMYSTMRAVGAPSSMKPRCMPGMTKRLRRMRLRIFSGVNRASSMRKYLLVHSPYTGKQSKKLGPCAPVHLWPLTFLALAFAIDRIAAAERLGQAVLRGWVFALGHFIVGLNWIAK